MDFLRERRINAGWTTWIVGVTMMLLVSQALAQEEESRVVTSFFKRADWTVVPRLAKGPEVQRWLPVQLDGLAALNQGSDLELVLFGRGPVRVVHRRTVLNPSGSVSWIGSVQGNAAESVVLVSREGITIGSMRIDGAVMMLYFAGFDVDGAPRHVLVEIDEASRRFRHADAEPPVQPDPGRVERAKQRERQMKGGAMPEDDATVHDLMVVYTPMALDELAGSVVAMENLIDLGVTETNMSYETSGIHHRLRLVHTALTNFDELEPTFIDARDHLQDPDDGYMDEIHAARDLHRADLVKLITSRGCGRAFIMDQISLAHADFAFCRTSVTCVSPRYTFAHEIGHVAAGRHTRPYGVPGSPLTYNFGYVDVENQFRTIMAAGDSQCPSGCPRRLAWSNPDVLDAESGAPMGVAIGAPEAADNRTALNLTAWTVANFRLGDSLLFVDGFETGNVMAWSDAEP